jgi:hypothetical protein
MWPLLLHCLAHVNLTLLLILFFCCRPRALSALIDSLTRLVTVLVGFIARDVTKSRAERAIEFLRALPGGRDPERRRDRRALPPGSSP